MQGFNMGRYVPPEHEGLTSGNKLSGKHALGSRARKAGQGILTVRFEMPFAVWCTNCPKESIIGQGVRFNAEKKKVGMYYSSPIYSFRMKHTACGEWIEIRTDPKNTAYVVTEGARKRDMGEDVARDGDMVVKSEEEKEKLRNDAFAALEVTIEGRQQEKVDKERINGLLNSKDRDWDDPYAVNKRLRNSFRVGRKQREHDQSITERIQDKYSLGVDLLPEDEADIRRASYVEFGQVDEASDVAIRRAGSRGLFSGRDDARAGSGIKKRLQLEVGHNTRAVTDPFLNAKVSTQTLLPGIKRKRDVGQDSGTQERSHALPVATRSLLVDYDSD